MNKELPTARTGLSCLPGDLLETPFTWPPSALGPGCGQQPRERRGVPAEGRSLSEGGRVHSGGPLADGRAVGFQVPLPVALGGVAWTLLR